MNHLVFRGIVNGKLMPFTEKKVTVTGTLIEKGGVKGMCSRR